MNQHTRDWVRYFVDYSALAVFLVAYFVTGRNIANATWALVVGSGVAIVVGLIVERRIAPMPLIVGALSSTVEQVPYPVRVSSANRPF